VEIAQIDPDVELLADIPIAGVDEDLLGRAPIALRVAELAIAAPVTAPRLVALTGDAGAGKSSVLRMAANIISTRAGHALVSIDGASHASAQSVMSTLVGELTKLFTELGVVEATDKVRNTLASYGGVVSSIAKLAGVKVDVAGALERSADSLRAEIAENLEQAAKRLVIVFDHLDRLSPHELAGVLAALRMYAAIPYVAIVIAVDRHARGLRRGPAALAFERMVQVELALPVADRLLLARVLAGGLERIATRMKRDFDDVLPLFDPEGGLALDLVESPRDAKRAVNALAAALPLAGPDDDVRALALEIVLRVIVPEIDATRLQMRDRVREPDALIAEIAACLDGHRRAIPARAALRALVA
jgi:hypothetical protein